MPAHEPIAAKPLKCFFTLLCFNTFENPTLPGVAFTLLALLLTGRVAPIWVTPFSTEPFVLRSKRTNIRQERERERDEREKERDEREKE